MVLVNALVDRLPRLRRAATSKDNVQVLEGIRMLLPHLGPVEQHAIMRGVLRNQTYTSIFRVIQTRFPALKIAAARCVPAVMSRQVRDVLASDRPVIIALPHIGPLYFALTICMRALRGRRVYGLQGDHTPFAQTNIDYLQRIGVTSVAPNEHALRDLARRLRTQPRSAVVIAFDYLPGGKRRTAELFGIPLAVPYGIAHLAEKSDAATLTLSWGSHLMWPRLVIGGPHMVDMQSGRAARQETLIRALFTHLEGEIRKHPQCWAEWAAVAGSIARAQAAAGPVPEPEPA